MIFFWDRKTIYVTYLLKLRRLKLEHNHSTKDNTVIMYYLCTQRIDMRIFIFLFSSSFLKIYKKYKVKDIFMAFAMKKDSFF